MRRLSASGLANGYYAQPTANGFITAQELAQQRKKVFKVSTGSKQFDKMLEGQGLRTSLAHFSTSHSVQGFSKHECVRGVYM